MSWQLLDCTLDKWPSKEHLLLGGSIIVWLVSSLSKQ